MSALQTLGSIAANVFGELVAPTRCAACDAALAPNVLFCPPCAVSAIRADPWDPRAGGCVAAFEYGGAIATAIGRLKYEDRPDLALRLARAMQPATRRLAGAIDLVVPVPLHAQRLAERGYNQAALLATPLARELSVRLAARALVRVRDTRKQVSLERDARLINLRSAFRSRAPIVKDARILLVDDVRTTGATLEACAAALHEVGARQVLALVLARRS